MSIHLDLKISYRYSFGYDCRKRFNLCVADPDTLIFASGNLIHIFKVSSNELAFRRCSTGGGIGHITVGIKRDFNLQVLQISRSEISSRSSTFDPL